MKIGPLIVLIQAAYFNASTQGRTQQISKGGFKKTSIPHSRADPENFGRGDEF